MKPSGTTRIYPFYLISSFLLVLSLFLCCFPELQLSSTVTTHPYTMRPIYTYDSDALKTIRDQSSANQLGKRLTFNTIRTVRELNLNKRKRGKRGGIKPLTLPTVPRTTNLQFIRFCNRNKLEAKIKIATMNCRSVRNKSELTSASRRVQN